jgi:hypothetical protein
MILVTIAAPDDPPWLAGGLQKVWGSFVIV